MRVDGTNSRVRGTSLSSDNRYHDIDALRVFAFSLLILYHVGAFYVAEWGWHVKSAYQVEWLQVPMSFTSQWRMSLLFMISGLAVSFVWGRYSPGKLAIRRVWRLLTPLLFGMAFVVAPQPYYEALNKGVIEPGFLAFMGQYLTFQDFPGNAWDGVEIITWTWNHLWYLAYVFFYTMLLIPVAMFLDGPGRLFRKWFQGLRGIWVVLLPLVPLMLYGNFVYPRFPDITHAFLDDWYAHAMYGTLFLYGYLIGRDEGFWAGLASNRKLLLFGAIIMYALFLARSSIIGSEPGILPEQANLAIIYLNRWLWVLTAFGWGHHLLNRPMKWLPYATRAVFPWYILHQTIIVVAGYELSKLALGPIVEPLLVLGLTIGGCFVLYEFVIRRVRFLGPLFGVSYPARRAWE